MPQTSLEIRKLVRAVKAGLDGAASPQSLAQRHELGDLINQLPATRGNDRFAVLATAFQAAGLSGFGVSNLRKLAKFAGRFSLDEAVALDGRGVSWRDADRLRSKHIKTKIGKALTKRAVRSFALTPRQLGRLVTEVSEPEARETRRSTSTAEKRANDAIVFLAGIVLRPAAETAIREDAHSRLLFLSRKAAKFLYKINRLANEPRPSSRKASKK